MSGAVCGHSGQLTFVYLGHVWKEFERTVSFPPLRTLYPGPCRAMDNFGPTKLKYLFNSELFYLEPDFKMLSLSLPLDVWGKKTGIKRGLKSPPPNNKPSGLYQSFASPPLTPLNYLFRGKEKQSLISTVVILISLCNITAYKRRPEELGCCCFDFSLCK